LIAADTSTWVAYLDGVDSTDTRLLDLALQGGQLLMPPAVLTELMSNPDLPIHIAQDLQDVPLIEIDSGFWVRAGQLRAKVLARRRKARLGDALIAQSCIDRGVALLTRDGDFKAFAETAKLELVKP
jgi:predicted nucleic acid-binding protein